MGTGPAINDRPQGDERRDVASPSGRQSLPLLSASPAPNHASFFDLVLTELDEAFVVRVGSPAGGQDVLNGLALAMASQEKVNEAGQRVAAAAAAMGRSVDVTDIRNLLHRNQEHPRWDNVADRCLACTNCTLVCPTCFCSSVEDITDLSVENAERVRRWDSCFNPEFARVHGGNCRPAPRSLPSVAYAQIRFAWYDQFDISGCVGCGRCITWCPVGIDVTEEITAIRAADGQRERSTQ